MIIDTHVHIGRLKDSPFAEITFEQGLARLLQEMKRNRIDHALVLPGFRRSEPNDPKTATALDLVRGAENVSVIGSIDVLDHDQGDIDQLDEWMERRLIVGMKLYPGYQHFYPDQDVCAPIYRLCLKHDMPVIFHAGDTLGGGPDPAKVRYAHPLAIDSVAADFPGLKIVIAHMGNPWFVDCAEVLYKNDNVYADLSGLVVRTPLGSPYGRLMRRRVRDLIAYSSPRKLLYGTDWPLTDMKPYLRFVRSLGLSQADSAYVFHKNAARLFGLQLPN